jgi:hypothetical protein
VSLLGTSQTKAHAQAGPALSNNDLGAGEVSDDTSDTTEDSAYAGSPMPPAAPGKTTDAALLRTASTRSNVRVSFDNILPSPQAMVHTASFTTKVSPVQSPPPVPSKRPASGSNKHHPQPSAPEKSDVSNFATTIQWGRERPETAAGGKVGGVPVESGHSKRHKEKEASPPPAPELPLVAESKRKSRIKTAPKPSGDGGVTGKASSKKAPKLPDNEISRNLLQHVKKVRSDQQLQAMVEYLNAGMVKVETNAQEKRRLKKLIKAWNASFEKKHGRLPTSAERSKGHLRELYEEYHQV